MEEADGRWFERGGWVLRSPRQPWMDREHFKGGSSSSVTVIAPTATELQGSVGFRSQNAEDLLQIDYQAILEVFDGIFFVFTAIIIQGFANLTYRQHLMNCIGRILGFAY